MIHGNRLNGPGQPIQFQRHPLAATPCYSATSGEKAGAGCASDQYYEQWVDERDVTLDERSANRDFRLGWFPIPGRAPEQDIGDVRVSCPVESDRGQHAVEQLPGGADEGQAGGI